MSTYEPVKVSCRQCGEEVFQQLLVGMHITRLPKVRSSIIQESFQHFECSSCHFVTRVEKPTIYTDFERKHYVGVELPEVDDWRARVAAHRTAFEQSFFWGPPTAQEMGRAMMTRVVFGLQALREKLLIWDAGLDDRVIELGKRHVLTESGVDPDAHLLRLSSVDPSSKALTFGLHRRAPHASVRSSGGLRSHEHRPVRTVKVFERTITRWHQQSHVWMRQHPWARAAWFVDASMAPG